MLLELLCPAKLTNSAMFTNRCIQVLLMLVKKLLHQTAKSADIPTDEGSLKP